MLFDGGSYISTGEPSLRPPFCYLVLAPAWVDVRWVPG